MKKDTIIAFNAQIMLDICESKKVRSCAIVTSLKKNDSVYSLSKMIAKEIESLGRKVIFCDSNSLLDLDDDTSLKICFAPNPNHNILSYNLCKSCDAIILIERYGYSNHYEFDELVCFLRKYGIEILGVWGVK